MFIIKDTTEYLKSVLFQKAFGHKQDSNLILFDKKKLLNNPKALDTYMVN